MTIREKILQTLKTAHGLSAWEVAKIIKERPDSVSSILVALHRKGLVTRQSGQGPRGGYGWSLAKEGTCVR